MIQTVFWQQMIVELGFSISQLNNGKSAQLAGLAIGCLVFIPLTVKFGRRSTYILSTAALAASCWWSAKMNTFAELILTNVLAGLAGAINETAVQMTVSNPLCRSLCLEVA
jgi:MFS family permease